MAKQPQIKAVEFVAEVRQVKTMADHTVNVTLNLPEYCIQQAAWFMQHQGGMIKSVAEFQQNSTNGQKDNGSETNRRSARNPLGMAGG